MDRAAVDRMLNELHAFYLRGNEHDEGDPIYYRINYRLADAFGISKEGADKLHAGYHSENPRQVSQGFCDRCGRVVTIIPVIYGVQASDMEKIKVAEVEGRLIVGETGAVRQESKVAMFGCRECRALLPKYGTI